MKRCFYHTDLGKNAVFHNFAIQIALIIHYDRSTRGLLAKLLKKKFQKHLYGWPVLTFDKRQSRLFKSRLMELYASS